MSTEAAPHSGELDLAVVVPTYNERENVVPLFERLERVRAGVRWEVLFVDDDSPDGTAAVVRDRGYYGSAGGTGWPFGGSRS